MAVREALPSFLAPMLASSGPAPAGERWAAEVKFDGWRAQARWDGSGLRLRTRSGRDCSAAVPELGGLGEQLADGRVLLDGELVCWADDGRPDFARLSARMAAGPRRSTHRVAFVAFDVLHLNGLPVRAWPYRERRAVLDELALDGPAWRTAPAPAAVSDLLSVTAAHRLEGVVAKRVDAPWRPGVRSSAWVKIKHRRTSTYTVTAWQPGTDGELDAYGLSRALPGGGLVPVGSVRFGLAGAERAQLRAAAGAAERMSGRRRRWRPLAPGLRVEVAHHGPEDGPLRDPVIRAVVLDAGD